MALVHCSDLFAVRALCRGVLGALDDEEFFVVEGPGWRGRRESDSQVTHPNWVHTAVWHGQTRHTS